MNYNIGKQGIKKPFYKNWWFIVIVIIAIILIIVSINDNNKKDSKKLENINWFSLELNEHLPEPKNPYGEVITNSNRCLTIKLYKVDKDYIDNYKKSCIDLKYNIESNEDDNLYEAFNNDGYKLRLLHFSDNELEIELTAPEEMSEFEWPIDGLGTMLPSTNSTYGRISWNNEETFIVHVGNTSIDEFNEYVNLCKEKEFNVNSSSSNGFYNAYNKDGYELTLRYLGFNTIEIALKVDAKNKTDNKDESKTNENVTQPPSEDKQETTSTTTTDETENNTATQDNPKDKYDTQEYKEKAITLFQNEGRRQYPYGIKFHWIVGLIDDQYQGNGNYYFRVQVTITNEYGTKRKGIATGYIDVKTNYIDLSVGLD